MLNKKRKFNNKILLKLLCAVLISLPCNAESISNFNYIQTNNSLKLTNPRYLNTSIIEKPTINIQNSIKHIGQFDESEYFSSEISEEDVIINQNSPPNFILEEPPPEIKNVSDLNDDSVINNFEHQQSKVDVVSDVKKQQNSAEMINLINNAFEPPVNKNVDEVGEEINNDLKNWLLQEIMQKTTNEVLDDSFNKEINASNQLYEVNSEEPLFSEDINNQSYHASVDTEEIDLEGRSIASINFIGLNKIKRDDILNIMSVKTGDSFDSNKLQEDLQNIYMLGYFTDEMAVEPEINYDGSVNLYFVLQENVLVKNIAFEGNTIFESNELLSIVENLKGLPQNIENINNAISQINDLYHQKGYILANVYDIEDSKDGELIFKINEGKIHEIKIEGNTRTKDYVIQRNILTQAGSIYNENCLKEDLGRVYSTHIFSDVNREITANEENPSEYDIKVIVKENSTNKVMIGAGIDSALGLFGSLTYKEDNFLGREQKLSATGLIGASNILSDASMVKRMNYQLELNFFEPYFLNADNSLSSKLYYRDIGSYQIPLAIERRLGFSTGINHRVKGYKNLTTSFNAGVENINLKEGNFEKIATLYALNGIDFARRQKELAGGFFLNLSPGIRYSTLDSDILPREGVIANAAFTEALSFSNAKNTNGRFIGGVTKYIPIAKKSSLSFSAKGGFKVHGDEMPEIMAFRLGGPYSVRGYRINGVGTGNGFLMGSAEIATPIPLLDRLQHDFFKTIRIAFFIDAGRVFEPTTASLLYDRPLSAISIGVGLKFNIPGIGPMSVDYGLPLTNTGRYGSRGGYFTFGSALYQNY